MSALTSVVVILQSLLGLYLLILLGRVVLDWIQLFARRWRPSGVVLLLANFVYALTDPPLRMIRRSVPFLRVGGLGIDLSFLFLYIGILVAQTALGYLLVLG